jgi:drug/metabolite transporter (DMT)-like permease
VKATKHDRSGGSAASIGLLSLGLGLAPLAKKMVLESGVPPYAAALASVAVAAVAAVLLLFVLSSKPWVFNLTFRTIGHVAVVGLIASGAVTLLAVTAMSSTTATNRSLFQAMSPVATVLAARLLLKETLSTKSYGLIAVMGIGLVLMNSSGMQVKLNLAFWLLAATLPLIGVADVYARKTLHDANPYAVAAGRFVFGGGALLLALPFLGPLDWTRVAISWPWIIGAGLSMTGGLVGLYRVMERAGASVAAAFAALAPVVTASAEYLLATAEFSVEQLLGLSLVVGGALGLSRVLHGENIN